MIIWKSQSIRLMQLFTPCRFILHILFISSTSNRCHSISICVYHHFIHQSHQMPIRRLELLSGAVRSTPVSVVPSTTIIYTMSFNPFMPSYYYSSTEEPNTIRLTTSCSTYRFTNIHVCHINPLEPEVKHERPISLLL